MRAKEWDLSSKFDFKIIYCYINSVAEDQPSRGKFLKYIGALGATIFGGGLVANEVGKRIVNSGQPTQADTPASIPSSAPSREQFIPSPIPKPEVSPLPREEQKTIPTPKPQFTPRPFEQPVPIPTPAPTFVPVPKGRMTIDVNNLTLPVAINHFSINYGLYLVGIFLVVLILSQRKINLKPASK